MKVLHALKVSVYLLITLGLFSCEDKCKECFLIEEGSAGNVETSIGEFCGDEIEEQESEEYIVTDGDAYVECP